MSINYIINAYWQSTLGNVCFINLCIMRIFVLSKLVRLLFTYIYTGLRLGTILSPQPFSIYVDDLYYALSSSNAAYFIDNVCIKHLIYANDICMFAPTLSSLHKLLIICDNYDQANSISFNSSKFEYVVFTPENGIFLYLKLSQLNAFEALF